MMARTGSTDWREDGVRLISLPGFGIAGMGWFMHGFAVGATNVVRRVCVPEEAVRLICDESVAITHRHVRGSCDVVDDA